MSCSTLNLSDFLSEELFYRVFPLISNFLETNRCGVGMIMAGIIERTDKFGGLPVEIFS